MSVEVQFARITKALALHFDQEDFVLARSGT
jgi:hypothetical protein